MGSTYIYEEKLSRRDINLPSGLSDGLFKMNINNSMNTETVESLIREIYEAYVHQKCFTCKLPDGPLCRSNNYNLLICGLIGELSKRRKTERMKGTY